MMITEKQIENLYNRLSPYFIDYGNKPVIISNETPLTPITIKLPEWRVIGVARHQESAVAMETFNVETRQTFYQNPQTVKQLYHPEEQKVHPLHTWRIKHVVRTGLWEVDPNIESEEKLQYFIMMNQKLRLLDYINDSLSIATHQYNSLSPSTMYLNLFRYNQCKEILEKDIKEDPLGQYQAVTLHAEETKTTLQEAAKELKFIMDCDISYLSEVAAMRKKYEQIISAETDIKMLKVIKSDYYKQNSRYVLFNS